MTSNRLRSLLEKQRGILQVRTVKLKKLRDAEKRMRQQCSVAQKGPAGLDDTQYHHREIPEEAVGDIAAFWRSVWEVEGNHEPHHWSIRAWKDEVRQRLHETVEGAPPDEAEVWQTVISQTKNWKAPGPDRLHGFWLKAFGRAAGLLRETLEGVLDGTEEMPAWLVRGRTVLIPKEGSKGEPYKFRYIAYTDCL